MKRRPWSTADEQILRDRYADTPTAILAKELGRELRAVYAKAKWLGLKKSHEYLSSAASGRIRSGEHKGMATWFKPGHSAWNKGKSYQPGGRVRETQFKPGRKPQTWVPIGTEVVDGEGYRKRKVRDDAPIGRSYRNWTFVHLLVWEEHHGQVPADHVIVFRNGDRSDLRIENLEAITRADLARRNSIHNMPPELKKTVQQLGRLKRQINKMTKEANP